MNTNTIHLRGARAYHLERIAKRAAHIRRHIRRDLRCPMSDSIEQSVDAANLLTDQIGDEMYVDVADFMT